MRRQLLASLLTAAITAGCVGAVDEAPVAEDGDRGIVAAPLAEAEARELAAVDTAKERKRKRRQRQAQHRAEGWPNDPAAAAAAAGAAAGGAKVTMSNDPADAAAPAPAVNAAFAELVSFDDRRGDASGEAPGYSDIQRVVIHSNGTTARVSLVVAADVPPALADGEVQGVGIDFSHSEDRESDYRLFADGGSKGWRAFLQGRDGAVSFQGAFRLGGNVMVFEVPWDALGGKDPAEVTVFSEWSRERAVSNAVGSDRAPDSGTATLRPARV